MDTVERRLRRIIELSLEVPYPESRWLIKILCTSELPDATTLRWWLSELDVHAFARDGTQEQGEADRAMHQVFATQITPRFVVGLIEQLVETGAFTRADAKTVEDAVLAKVDLHGHWKAI